MSKERGETLSSQRRICKVLQMTAGLYSYSGRKNQSINRRKLKSRRKKHEQGQKRKISSIWKQQILRNANYLPEESSRNEDCDFKAFSVDICCGGEVYQDNNSLAGGSFSWNKSKEENIFSEMNLSRKQIYQPAMPCLNPNG